MSQESVCCVCWLLLTPGFLFFVQYMKKVWVLQSEYCTMNNDTTTCTLCITCTVPGGTPSAGEKLDKLRQI